jgi:hypothetical protein
MSHRYDFDELAKDLAQGVSRREVLWRAAGGLMGAMLASVGMQRAWGDPNPCATFCRGLPSFQRRNCNNACKQCGGNTQNVCPSLDSEKVACCSQGTGCCSGACTTLGTNQNCSGCGNVCTGGSSCVNGTCQCPTDQRFCPGGTTCCAITRACCDGGVCCGLDESCCGGKCVNTQTSTSNCGLCGKSCNPGETCVAGACRCGSNPGCSAGQDCISGICCPSGQTVCNGACCAGACSGGFCVQTCSGFGDPSCGPGAICHPASSFCSNDPDHACSDDEDCFFESDDTGTCNQQFVCLPNCGSSTCFPGYVCTGDSSDPCNCTPTSCLAGSTCVSGHCLCADGHDCTFGLRPLCCGSTCCRIDQSCVNGSCV